MDLLRTVLYLHAGIWGLVGLGLAIVPRPIVQGFFDRPELAEYEWVRLVGILLLGLAMQMVLVGHRVEELWWWSWGFALSTGGVAALCVLRAAFGPDEAYQGLLWWLAGLVSAGLASALLLGMSRAGRERPLDRFEPAPARKPRPAR